MLNPNSALSIAVATDPNLMANMMKAVDHPSNAIEADRIESDYE